MTDPRDIVLLDALCERYGYTRAEAEEALRYAANAGSVRKLVPLAVARIDEGECGCGYVTRSPVHASGCEAWRALCEVDPTQAQADCGAAWDEGAILSPFAPMLSWRSPMEGAPRQRAEYLAALLLDRPPPLFITRETLGLALAAREVADADAPVQPLGPETSDLPR